MKPVEPTPLRSRLSRVVRNERPESKPPDPSHHGFDTTSSFVAGRLNQLWRAGLGISR